VIAAARAVEGDPIDTDGRALVSRAL